MLIAQFYAALLALLFLFLSERVTRLRRRFRIALGDGGNPALQRAIRAHGNFAEYVPFCLLLLFAAAWQNASPVALHVWGIMLCGGRAVHAYGVSQVAEKYRFRITGMVLTFTFLGTIALYLLVTAVLGS